MAPKVKRTAVTLDPATDAILAKLSSLQRRPKSRIIAELLAEIAPPLARVADLLELAQKNREALPADTAHRLGALEELLGHTATFALDRLQANLTPPEPQPAQPARPGRRKGRH